MLENHAAQLDEPARQSLERMRDASRRMTLVFDGLETLFKLTSGEIRRADVDLTAMANDIVARQRERQPERKVRVDIAPEMVVNGDPRLVRMLVETLIDNAWKFTGPKPDAHITVGQEIVDGESRTFVKDDGVGYDMIDSHRLFGAFQRLHTQAEFPGIGIGLAIARRIVNRHGGRIWAEGAAGEGAAFYFIL
jgi:light-regulated signal transduction histidine kinase (bacteriophytochrome)